MAILFLVLYSILLLIRPHEWFSIGVAAEPQTPYVKITLLICMAFYMFQRQKNLDLPQTRFMLFFTVTILLSLIFSGWIGSVFIWGVNFIQQSLIPFLLFSALIDTRKKLYAILVIIVTTAVIMVVNGHYQKMTIDGIGLLGNPAYRAQEFLRITYFGYFNDPNDLGMFLAMTIPVVFFLKNRYPTVFRFPFWGILAVILYGIYLTNSRGTLVATIGLLGYWFWLSYGTKKTIVVSTALLPALYFVISKFRTISTEEESAEGRLEAWYEGYQMLISNPVFGVGQAQFLEYHFRTAHNSFVLAFSELGLLGLFAWCGLLTSTMIILFRIAKKSYLPADLKPEDPRYIVAQEESSIAKMFIYVFIAFFGSAFFLSRTYIPFLYLMIGLSTSSLARVRAGFPDLKAIFTYRELLTTSLYVTVGGVIGIYILLKLFL